MFFTFYRIQLLTAVLQKSLFRRHQLQKAMQWKDVLLAGDDNIVNYYLALNSSFPQVQKQPLDLLQFSREEEKVAEDNEKHLQKNMSPRQCYGENNEILMLVSSQQEAEGMTNIQSNPNNQKSSGSDKEYFVSLSSDNDWHIPPLLPGDDIKPSISQNYSTAHSANNKYTKSMGMKFRKDRKQARNQPLKKSKKSPVPSFSQSSNFPSSYKESEDEDEDEDLLQVEKDYGQSVNWLGRGRDSHEMIIKEIKKVTSSNLPNDEKVNLVQNLLSMLQLQSPNDTPTDSAYLMALQEAKQQRPRLNSLNCRSSSGAISKTTAGLSSKAHHSHHHHPRTTRTKTRKSSTMDSRGKVSDLEERNKFVSTNPMICSCIQLNCGHNNLLRLQDEYLSHSMHNLGRDEIIYDKLSDTISLTKEHDSYPNLNHPENLLANTASGAYNNPPWIPSNFVHRPHSKDCPGRPPSPMAEWMNCCGAADVLAEDFNTVSLYSSSWDRSESEQ